MLVHITTAYKSQTLCYSAYCKQAALEGGGGGGGGGGDAIVPSQHLPKDSATLRSYTLMSYCKLVSWEKNAPTVVSMAKRYQPLSFMS